MTSEFNSYVTTPIIVSLVTLIVFVFLAIWFIEQCRVPLVAVYPDAPSASGQPSPHQFTMVLDSQIKLATVEEFINEITVAKLIRFVPEQLAGFTRNYATRLGSGGFGTVYKGKLPNGILVAVKVLNGNLDKRVKEQFMAEVATLGRIDHINLARLYGFCFNPIVIALVYEYMENGSLDMYLFDKKHKTEWNKLREIAIGTAKGLRYLHEECQHKIIHYDIKPGNILLDAHFAPKVADFGLAKLCSREITHMSNTGGRGTPGYAAPEMWMPCRVTDKCDVYSFGMLLFEIVGRRRNLDISLTESEEWFPLRVWEKLEDGKLQELTSACGIEEDRENVERMCKVALWCTQYKPEERPPISKVVKMLEGEMEITPPKNPFLHMLSTSKPSQGWSSNGTSDLSKSLDTETGNKNCANIMKKYEIEMVASS